MSSGDTFVGIPCYRDEDCINTVRSLFEMAWNPAGVYIGVFLQFHPAEDLGLLRQFLLLQRWVKDTFGYDHLRIKYHSSLDAKGPYWARSIVESLFTGQPFYLQIDCHMRFTRHWDVSLKRMLSQCKSDQPILTTYPAPLSLYDENVPSRTALLCAKKFSTTDGFLRVHSRLIGVDLDEPIPSLFWAAGFAFSSSDVIEQVPYLEFNLPYVFFGEENLMAARLWTKGWDFFCPNEMVIYHDWARKQRCTFDSCFSDPKEGFERYKLRLKSQQLVYRYLSQEIVIRGKRTLDQYFKHIGVSIGDKVISERALNGGLDSICFYDPLDKILSKIQQFQ